ncbi:MAG: hypothetical protein IPH12_13555 [Saprospirales bacterium]|nr:hypothetical protein [Saprospirales bacterium]
MLSEARELERALQAQLSASAMESEGAAEGDALTGLLQQLDVLKGALPDFSAVDPTIVTAVERLKNAGESRWCCLTKFEAVCRRPQRNFFAIFRKF